MDLRPRVGDGAPPGAGDRPLPLGELTAEDLVRLGRARTTARRERQYAAAGLAVLVLVGAVALAAARDQGRDTRLTSAPAGSTATTAPPPATSSTTTGSAATGPATTTAPAPTTTTAAPAATTTTAASTTSTTAVPAATVSTSPEPTCRNSSDRACGPFRFDPQPGPDRPMTLRAAAEPPSPQVGSPFELRAVLTDPDGVWYNAWSVDFGDGTVLGASGTATCDKFGAWDPPAANPAAAAQVRTFSHAYRAPGTYTVRLSFEPGPYDCVDAVSGVGEQPYASAASTQLVVIVVPR